MLEQLQSFAVDETPENSPRIVKLDSESANAVLKAIGSETTRDILACLHEDPQPPSRLADAIDTSIANVDYHLRKLQDAGLITAVDTWYSEKGNEMQVYAPTCDPLVFAGTEDRTARVRSLFRGVATAFTLLIIASGLVQWLVTDFLLASQRGTTVRKATSAGAIDGLNLTPIPPGVLFFTGGTFILAIVTLVWYTSAVSQRPTP